MKPALLLLPVLCSLSFVQAAVYTTDDFNSREPIVSNDITLAPGTEIKDVKVDQGTETLIQVEDGGTLTVQPGLTVEKIVSTDDAGGLISLGEGAEAVISGPASITDVRTTGSGGVVYMGADSTLTLRTNNAGERLEMSENKEDVMGDPFTSSNSYPNDVYMEAGAELVVDAAAGSTIVLGSGVEAADEATLTKIGDGTLELGDTAFFENGHLLVEAGNLLLLQENLTANELKVSENAALTLTMGKYSNSIGDSFATDSIILNGALRFVYSPLWEENADGTAAVTLHSGSISIGETATATLTLTEDILETIAEGGEFSAWMVDTSRMDASVAEAVQLLLTNIAILNEQGETIQGMAVHAENGRIVVTPEPATATLSLLALSALCLRRRRA